MYAASPAVLALRLFPYTGDATTYSFATNSVEKNSHIHRNFVGKKITQKALAPTAKKPFLLFTT